MQTIRVRVGDHGTKSYQLKDESGTAVNLSAATAVVVVFTNVVSTTVAATVNATFSGFTPATVGWVQYDVPASITTVQVMMTVTFQLYTGTQMLTYPLTSEQGFWVM